MPMTNPIHEPEVLFITYNLSPRLGAQSIQVSRQINFYRGISSIVYGDNTVVDNKYLDVYTDLSLRHTSIVVHPIFKYKSILSRAMLKLFPFVGMLPDPYLLWSVRAFCRITWLISTKKLKPDCIVVFGNPMSVVLAGLLVSRIFNLPIISSLSDPWPWVRNDYCKTNSRFIKAVNRLLESLTFNFSTVIVTNNTHALSAYTKIFPDSNISVVPHCYDSTLYRKSPGFGGNISDVNKVVRIIGSFYGPRNLDIIFPAFMRFCSSNAIVVSGIKFSVELYGSYDAYSLAKSLRDLGIDHLIDLKGSVSYRESLDLMSSADILLLVDGFVENNIFLPSKIVDYIGSGALIAAVTPRPSPTRDLLMEHDHLVFDPTDVPLMFDVFPAALQRHCRTSLITEKPNNYEAHVIAEQIRSLVLNTTSMHI